MRQQAVANVARLSERGSSLSTVTSTASFGGMSPRLTMGTNNYALDGDSSMDVGGTDVEVHKLAVPLACDEEEAFGGSLNYITLHEADEDNPSSSPPALKPLVWSGEGLPAFRTSMASVV